MDTPPVSDLAKVCIIVRGTNDIASAIAHRLFSAGYLVVLHDDPQPTVTRRKMAFADALFDGEAVLAGVSARQVTSFADLVPILLARAAIPVTTATYADVLSAVEPTALIDARMRKRAVPERQRGSAPLTIGLGPNFIAGEQVDVAIETSWEDLGRVVERGATRALAGEPKAIAGHARDRYVYAPVAGPFRTRHAIGDQVQAGEMIAMIGEVVLHAPLSGVVRGLTHNGVLVAVATKVIEVDPRGDTAQITGIGERPGRIAEGVLHAVTRFVADLPGLPSSNHHLTTFKTVFGRFCAR